MVKGLKEGQGQRKSREAVRGLLLGPWNGIQRRGRTTGHRRCSGIPLTQGVEGLLNWSQASKRKPSIALHQSGRIRLRSLGRGEKSMEE